MRNMKTPEEVIVGARGFSGFLFVKRFAERYKNPRELCPGVLFG